MPQDELGKWKDEFAKLPVDAPFPQGPKNLAKFVFERVNGKLSFSPSAIKIDPPATFSWQKSLFETPLLALIATADHISPKIILTNAWSASVLASSMVISPGSKIDPPPPGTNGIVGTALAIIDPPTVVLATAAFLAELIAAALVGDAEESVFPKACRAAFSKITYTITGIDTTAPTPIPILLPLTAVK
jgi:hypothetical protein